MIGHHKTSEVHGARCATIALCAEAHVEIIAREADALTDSAKFELAMLRRDVKDLVSALAGGIGGRPVESTREIR